MSTATPMPPAVSMPRLPSMSEIEKALREKLPGLTVYNPSESWIQIEVFGLTNVWACPDLNGEYRPHPVTNEAVKCDGRTVVRGRFLTQKDSSGKEIQGQDAPSMVKFIVSPERYGQMGFVWLPGSSVEEDERLKVASKSTYLAFQRQADEMIVNRRVEFKKNWTKGPHKSEPCPPPTEAEMAAMDRLQERKSVKTWKYECDVVECETGYGTDDWDKFSRHMKLAHKIHTLDRAKFDGEIGALGKVVATDSGAEVVSPTQGIAAAAQMLEKKKAEVEPEPEVEPEVEPDRPVRRRR